VPVYHFQGDAGRNVYVQAGMHGPEIQGIAVAYRLVEYLKAERTLHGSVTVVPAVNPAALDLKMNGLQVGYTDPNEHVVGNFNRVFPLLTTKHAPLDPDPVDPLKVDLSTFVASHRDSSVESIEAAFKAALLAAVASIRAKTDRTGVRFGLHLALTIQEMTTQADTVIDLHTDARAIYYGYSAVENIDGFRALGVPHCILLDPNTFDGCFDEQFIVPWIELHGALSEAGREMPFADLRKEAFTLEVGNADEVDRDRADEDAKRILNYLRLRGVLEGKAQNVAMPVDCCLQKHRDNYYADLGGLVFWHKRPGDKLQAGDVVATILAPATSNAEGKAVEYPILAKEPGLLINVARSQVAYQGIQIFSVLTHLQTM
jgi:predicted deacylase